MPSRNEAVSFTDALLHLRTGPALRFAIGDAFVEVTPDVHLRDAEAEGLKWTQGKRLKAVRFDLHVQDVGREYDVPVYLAAGDWYGDGSQYLIVYVKRSRTAQEFNMMEGLIRDDGGRLHLWSSKRLFPNRPPQFKERLIAWMERLGRGRGDAGRLWVGSDGNLTGLVTNILTLAILKEHLRGNMVIEALANGLPPARSVQDVRAAALPADEDAVEDDEETGQVEPDEDWEGLKLTPPTTVPRKRKRGGHPVQIDFAALTDERKEIGDAAERLVVQYEQAYLRANGKKSLADSVEHVAHTQGDGTGYDIRSYTLDGKPLYIEVKATRGKASAPFFLTPQEWAMARRYPSSYRLYRVYDLDPENGRGRFFIIRGRDLDSYFAFEPAVYRLRLKRQPPALDR